MLLQQLFESDAKHLTFVFGRLNPPTRGHEQLLDTAAAQGGDYKIFVSQSQDKKKNPLDYATKIKFIREMFPKHADHVVEDTSLNTIMKIASYIYDQGYNAVTFVAGSDRLEDMKKLLQAYNGVEGKAHGFYDFQVLDFISSGEREDGAEGVAGVSASGARTAAAEGDLEAFKEATGAGELAKPLYDAVRKGMGLKDTMEEGKFRSRDIEEKLIDDDRLDDLKSKYLPDWEMLDHKTLQAKYVAKDHRHAEDFVSYINKVSEKMDHFAEVTQDVAEVTVKTTTFDVKGLTVLDFKLALKVDKFAEDNDIEQVRMQGNFGMHEMLDDLGNKISEAPIEMDPADPMDPMIHGHQGANPGKLKYRMARAARQLKDLAARVDGADPSEWQRMAQQFEELKMNMEQIRHALEELSKIRKKGGIRSRGITI